MAVKQLPTLSPIPEPPNRLVGDQERFDTMTFNSLKAQEKMVNVDLNQNVIPALNQFAVDVNASVDAAKASETLALASKNAAASSAATATTKAGEAAASATAAKASETSALASKNAASSSATAAANAQKAAEAARDEAQGLANVGYASESRAGLAKVDGKTTQAAADGAITVKDVAIGGNLEDLASARGFFYDTYLPYYPGIGTSPVEDFDLLTLPGKYHIVVSRDTLNLPGVRLFTNSGTNDGILEITKVGTAATVSGYQRLQQRFTVLGTAGNTWSRYQDTNATKWFNWEQEIRSSDIGDGIRITNTKLSVPEYEGATASSAGTSGLVPPAAAGQQESFLTGGGEYKPALTKISDSVNLADSTTAASAKAVKTAYDLANSKQANLGFTPVQQGGGAGQEGQKIYIGWSPSGLKAQADVLDLGNIVTTSAGCTKAPSAANADYANTAKGIGDHSWLDVIDTGGNPQWVVGLATDGSGKIKPILPASLRTAYAWAATTVPSVATGNANQAVPAGGTWTFIVSRNGEGNIGTIAGGTVINQGVWLAIRVA